MPVTALPVTALPVTALAETLVSPQEVQVLVNSLKYVIGLPSSNEPLRIMALYNPAKSESKAEAETFVKQLATSKIAKGRHLTAMIGTLKDAESTKVPLLFVPKGFSAHYAEISKIAETNHLFPLTTDKECVVAKACILSFSVGESIEIFLSESALKTSGFDVDAAFRFMARPI